MGAKFRALTIPCSVYLLKLNPTTSHPPPRHSRTAFSFTHPHIPPQPPAPSPPRCQRSSACASEPQTHQHPVQHEREDGRLVQEQENQHPAWDPRELESASVRA